MWSDLLHLLIEISCDEACFVIPAVATMDCLQGRRMKEGGCKSRHLGQHACMHLWEMSSGSDNILLAMHPTRKLLPPCCPGLVSNSWSMGTGQRGVPSLPDICTPIPLHVHTYRPHAGTTSLTAAVSHPLPIMALVP